MNASPPSSIEPKETPPRAPKMIDARRRPKAPAPAWTKTLEPVFTLVLSASFLVHAAFTLVVFNVEAPPPPSMSEVLQRMKALLPPPEVRAAQIDTSAPVAEGSRPEAEKKTKPKQNVARRKNASPPSSQTEATAPAPSREDVRRRLANRGLLALIGEAGGSGSMGDVFGAGSVLDNMNTDLDGLDRIGLAGRQKVTRRSDTDPGCAACSPGALDDDDRQSLKIGKLNTESAKRPKRATLPRVDPTGELRSERPSAGKEVRRILNARRAAFQQCYQAQLKQNAELHGKLKMEFVIGESGRVQEARAMKDGLGSPGLVRCVAMVLRRLRFDASDEEFSVQNAFVFTSGG